MAALVNIPGALAALAVLAIFQWLGTLLVTTTGLPLPGPVAGLAMLLISLLVSGDPPAWFSKGCSLIIGLLSLFFYRQVPASFFLGICFVTNGYPYCLPL
jgi:Putative effector of murein hydrolase LrgA